MNNSKRLAVRMSHAEVMAGWIYLPFYLFILAIILETAFSFIDIDFSSIAGKTQINAVFFIANFLICLLIFHKFLLDNLSQLFKHFWGFVQAAILGLVMYYVGLGLVNLATEYIMPELVNLNDEQIFSMARENEVIMLVGVIFLVPLAEECIFRGFIFSNLYHRSRILAYVLTIVIFALIHVVEYIGQGTSWQTLALSSIQYLPAGISLAWAYERADSIFAPMVMHCLINAAAMGYGLHWSW